MESAKYTIKEAVQAIQELDFRIASSRVLKTTQSNSQVLYHQPELDFVKTLVTSTHTLKKECKTMTFLT